MSGGTYHWFLVAQTISCHSYCIFLTFHINMCIYCQIISQEILFWTRTRGKNCTLGYVRLFSTWWCSHWRGWGRQSLLSLTRSTSACTCVSCQFLPPAADVFGKLLVVGGSRVTTDDAPQPCLKVLNWVHVTWLHLVFSMDFLRWCLSTSLYIWAFILLGATK